MLNCLWILCIIAGTVAADLKTPKNSGIIVNPFYDPKDEANDIKKDLDEIIPPTHQQLAETLNLRNIINNAVRTNTYAVGGSESSNVSPKYPKPFSWFMNFLASKSSKNVGSSNGDEDDELGSDKVVNTEDNSTLSATGSNEVDDIKSNSIDSAIIATMESKPFVVSPKRVQREQLELISIEEDSNFPHGQNIRSWTTIESGTNGRNGLIGISSSSLVLIADRNEKYEIIEELDLKSEIRCVTNFKHWNETSKSIHGVLIVEIANQLLFISTRDDLNGLSIVWQWTIHSSFDALVYFKHESSDMLLMVNSPLSDDYNGISSDIYKFDLQMRHTWLVQKISLKHRCKSALVINTHKELILCFAQNNTVELYKTQQQTDSPAFKYFSSIDANSVQKVSGFQMGGFSYLATTGIEPKIFRYHRGRFVPQTILSRRWGLVELILPIPARTYRDDLILLVQHRINMGTHTVTVVEALVWDGESFDVSLSVPCRMNNEILSFGMTCLLDYDRDSGIDGLSIIQNGNSISLIVPRVEAPSSLFRLTFHLQSFDSPISSVVKDFEVASKYIEATSNYQNEIMATGSDALTRGLNANRNDITGMWNMSTVTAGSLIVNEGAMSKIDEIFFVNEKWLEDDLNADVADLWKILQQLQNDVDSLEKEFTENHNVVAPTSDSPTRHVVSSTNGKFDMNTARVIKGDRRTKRTVAQENRKNFKDLNVKRIQVEYINGVPIDDIVFTNNGVLDSVNSLVVEDTLSVADIETVGESIDNRHLLDKFVSDDNIHLTGDVIIDSINGVVWQDLVQQIVMRNLPNLVDELIVVGDVVAQKSVQVDFLNRMSFPRDFLWMHDSDTSIITGRKDFKGILTVDSVDTSGTIDGIYTPDTISLGETQHIGGLTTFTQLEVTETLDVNGTINGKHLNDFKPNLSLQETNVITSDCLFQNLHVQGPIYISNDCNGVILDDIFADVVYKSNPKPTITAFKTFESVDSIVELTSNLLNDIPIGNYMTADTAQDINIGRFVGNVMIQQLYTNGLFNFINVTELDRNSIKLSGEQFTEAEIIFDGNDDVDIDADLIEIQRIFNGVTINDLIRVDESLEINGNVVVNTALIHDLVISGEVNGNGVVNGINLSEFDATRFSRSRPQDITAIYSIENVRIDNEIDATYVNGIDIIDLRKHINHITNLPEYLSSNDVKVNNLVINGNVMVQTVNRHDFNSIRDNAVWLNQPNIVSGELQFLDAFEIGQGVIVNNVNNEIFEDFVAGIVLKTDENVVFTGRMIFQNDFHVDRDIQVGTLNGIPITNIWTKGASPQINGGVNVVGNLFVENVNLQGYVNSINWREIEDNYYFDVVRGGHVLRNNVRFTSPTNINHLHIQHGLNSVENVTDFLANIIRKNHRGIIVGKKQFQGNSVFTNNLNVASMDGVNVPSLFDSIVINDVNQKITVVGDVAFDDEVAASHIHVSDGILTATLMDCRLAEWSENTLRIDAPVRVFQQVIFPVGTLQTSNVELQFLNGYEMTTIFTLNTDQFLGPSRLSDLVSLSSINVDGLVNGYNARALMDNAVLVTVDNYITAPTTVQSARVLSVLQTVDTINGKNLNNVATLHEDLHLYGPLSFRSIKARNLITKDTISGIDFDYWYGNTLWKAQRENQIVRGVWTVAEGILHSSIKGNAALNGIAVDSLAGQITAQQTSVMKNLDTFYQSYVENCHRMQHLIERTQTLPYFLTHFEESFSLRVPNVLNSVHFFDAHGDNYVVLNFGCLTVVYVWNRYNGNYEKVCETETGNVDAWLDLMDEQNLLHLISNTEADRSNCPTSGLNIWKFANSALVHVSKITDSNKFSLLHRSKLHPQRFLAVAKDDGVVNAFDLQNNLVEQWHLPVSDEQFRFVPEDANLGIALTNGKQLSSLSYASQSINVTDTRKERSAPSFYDEIELKRFVRCPYLNEKLVNVTNKCKLWHQANLKAISNIGPFKMADLTTTNRLLEDVNASNALLGKPLFKLKSIPSSEARPLNGFNFSQISSAKSQQSSFVGSAIDTDPFTATRNQPGNDRRPYNSTARDAFGDIEKATIDFADNLVDTFVDLDADEEGVDFDDSLVGESQMDKIKSNPLPNSTGSNQSATTRDMFGDIEAATIKTADKLIDSWQNLKDNAKESQAKLHNLFKVKPPVLNGHHFREMADGREKFENKNLPKIPKVMYETNTTELHHTTQAPLMDRSDEKVADSGNSATSTEGFTTTTDATTTNEEQNNVGVEEPKISQEISSEGIATAENLNFPNQPAEEIIGINVGNKKKHLVAVSSLREHTIQGKHDLIRIYEDIIEGNLFQTLLCHRPRSLSVLNVRDETILAFVENEIDVQIFVYRGIQGFVKFTSFEMPAFVLELTPIHLPVANPSECAKAFLAATMKKEIRFIEAKSCGYCGVNAQLRCE